MIAALHVAFYLHANLQIFGVLVLEELGLAGVELEIFRTDAEVQGGLCNPEVLKSLR